MGFNTYRLAVQFQSFVTTSNSARLLLNAYPTKILLTASVPVVMVSFRIETINSLALLRYSIELEIVNFLVPVSAALSLWRYLSTYKNDEYRHQADIMMSASPLSGRKLCLQYLSGWSMLSNDFQKE